MANEQNNGTDKLKERILAAAQADATAAAEQAKKECEELNAQTESWLERNQKELDRQRENAVQAVLERSRTNAELAARKEALGARRAVVERAFEAAYQELCALAPDQRAQVFRKMLSNEAQGGETVLAAASDQAGMEKIMLEISKEFEKNGKQPLHFSSETADVEYGFVLKGAAYEKDCSFMALLRDVRMQEETGVAGILFD